MVFSNLLSSADFCWSCRSNFYWIWFKTRGDNSFAKLWNNRNFLTLSRSLHFCGL